MGDADSEIAVPVQEIEQWMDVALEVVDEGLENLVAFTAHLYLYKNQISLRLKNLENFRHFFTALNLLVVPVVIVLLFSYGSSSYEYDLEALMMFISGCIGLPFYLFSACQYYVQEAKVKKELRKLSMLAECEDDDPAFLTSGDSFANFLSSESSVDRLHDFARMLSNRMMGQVQTVQVSRSASRCQEDKSPDVIVTNPFEYLEDANSSTDATTGKQDPPEVIVKENAGVNFPVLYEFQIRMKEQSPSLEVKIEPCDDEREEPIEMADKPPYMEQDKAHDKEQDMQLNFVDNLLLL